MLISSQSYAQEPFLGEIRLFAGNFAPRGWAFCDGQLLAIASNDALFSLVGTIYGGDARTTFGLPDLRGRVPIGQGQGPGLNDYRVGNRVGAEQVTLLPNNLPVHNHNVKLQVSSGGAQDDVPNGNSVLSAGEEIYVEGTASTVLNPSSVSQNRVGQTQPHNNIQPSLGLNYIIALYGIYPSRN